MMKHLFLTGEKQVGKSTLLRQLMEEKRLDCTGFETRPFYENGERKGFVLHGRVDMPAFENDCIVSVRIAQRKSVPVLPVFEENGVSILRQSLGSTSPYLLMDELGKLEAQAGSFCQQVLDCLDGEKRVIGVLQQCESPLIKAIRDRGDVEIVTVTQENRDSLLEELLTRF